MDYTFLPYTEEKDLKRKYRIRASIVLLFFLSVSGVIGIGSLFPAYIHASLEESVHLRDIAALKEGGIDTLKTTEQDLSASTALMSDLAGSITPGPFSGVVASIASARGNVQINSFSLSRVTPASISIAIQGLAPTRSSLLSFKSRLDALAPGISVTLPVSELAHDTDIQFSIEITEPMP